ncbi:MAG: toxin HipA [Proteobacteria bacterium]|nr:MAG: toxin HipA [Pseudomonadota bacterium]
MRKARIFVNGIPAGYLIEYIAGESYEIIYDEDYSATPISLTMPTEKKSFRFKRFPSYFDGLLPEGQQLEALLRKHKIDSKDYFSQIVKVGADLVGAVSVKEIVDE